MNAIIGMTELTKQEADNKQSVLENLEIIDSSANLLLRIINDVLDMSKIESGTMSLVQEPFDFKEESQRLAEVSHVMMAAKNQIFEFHTNVQHRSFIGDVTRVNRVILNLLNNAHKFTPAGGTIKVLIREKAAASGSIPMLEFVVSDTGIGIPKEKMNAIFEPFVQLENSAENEGTGLGLSIVKNIVETKNLN